MSTTALLIIDVQQALIDEGPADPDAFLGRVSTLLAEARAQGVAVVFIQHDGPAGDTLFPGEPGWEIHPAVRPLAGETVFRKRYNSAFQDTPLQGWLQARGIGRLVVVGMQTEYCVDASLKSALERGYKVTMPEGGHTTCANGDLRAEQIRDFYQDRIWRGRYAVIESLEQRGAAWFFGG